MGFALVTLKSGGEIMHASDKNAGKYGLFVLLLTVMVGIWGGDLYSFRGLIFLCCAFGVLLIFLDIYKRVPK